MLWREDLGRETKRLDQRGRQPAVPLCTQVGSFETWRRELLEWIVAWMRKSMMHNVLHDGYNPRFYKPEGDHLIVADHVARFFWCRHACMMRGHLLIENSWSTRDSLHHVGPYAGSMPLSAFKDMHRCLHFVDDWEEDADAGWKDVYLNENVELQATAKHHVQFGMVEDTFNKRWKELVTYGQHITFEEYGKSRVAGWHNFSITIGPKLKHIRSGATLHLRCVTFGPLRRTNCIFVCTVEGKTRMQINN